MRVARLAWVAVAAVAAERLLGGPWLAWAAVAGAAIAAWPVPARWRWPAAVFAAAAAVAALERAPAVVAAPGIDDRAVDVIDGWVVGPLTPLAGATAMVVDSDVGAVWVVADGAPLAWPGDQVRVHGRLRSPRGFRNPGSPDRVAVARNRGARWELMAESIEVVGARWSGWRWPARAAHAASRAIADRGGDAVGNALVRAVVVGDRSAVDDATDDAWRAAGVYHALSVSGLHLAVVAMGAFAALTRALALVAPLATRVAPRRLAAGGALAVAVAYTLVTGGQVATVRALVVVAVLLVGEVLERRARAYDALGLAALIAIAQRPSVVWDPAFELSFVAALVLVACAPPSPARGRWWRRATWWLVHAVRVSWCVTAATAPITAWHFGQVAVGGVIGNLIAGPALELVALPLGLCGSVLGAAWPSLGGAVLDGAIAAAGVAAWVIARLARWTPVLTVAQPSVVAMVAASLVFAAWWLRRHHAPRHRVAVAWVVAVAIGVGAVALRWRDRRDDMLRVTFLDVGQGDAAVLEFPDGAVWLIDAGGAPGAPTRAAELAPGRAVAAFLRHRGIAAIDVAVVSHPHPDHYLGLLAVAAAVPVRRVWAVAPPDDEAPAIAGRSRSFPDVAAALATTGTVIEAPRRGPHHVGDVEITVLAPRGPDGGVAADPVWSVNDNSLVVRVRRGAAAVLFLGDLEAEGEEALVAAGEVSATVVKVAHHGSPTSSTPALVAATRPRWAVLSLGRANRFGFPAPAVVARWRAVGADVVRTDLHGAITARIDAAGAVALTTFDPVGGETPAAPRVIMPR